MSVNFFRVCLIVVLITSSVLCHAAENLSYLDDLNENGDSENIELISSIYNHWPFAGKFAIQDSILYLMVGHSRIVLIDISDPAQPQEISAIDGVTAVYTSIYDLEVSENVLYVADGDSGLYMIDVSDPFSPSDLDYIEDIYNVREVTAGNDLLALSCGYDGIYIFDISTPSSPQFISQENPPGSETFLKISNNTLFFASDFYDPESQSLVYSTLHIFDLSTPAQPLELGSIDFYNPNFQAYRIKDVALDEEILYLIYGRDVYSLDISDPTNPEILNTFESAGYAYSLALDNDILCVADCWQGLRVLDVSNPSEMVEIALLPFEETYDVIIDNNFAYLTSSYTGLSVVDISDINDLNIYAQLNNCGKLWDATFHDESGLVYIADGYEGLKIVDASDPYNPVEISSLELPGIAYKILTRDNYAYVACGHSGLRIIDISDPENPFEAGFYEADDFIIELFFCEDYLLAGSGAEALIILDISNIENVVEINRLLGYEAIFTEDNYVYYACRLFLRKTDISDPYNPQDEFCMWNVDREINDLFVEDEIVYIAGNQGFYIFDIADFSNPVQLSSLDYYGVYNIEPYQSDYLIITKMDDGISIINKEDNYNPIEVGFYDSYGEALNVFVVDNNAYLSDLYSLGLYDCSGALKVTGESENELPQEFQLISCWPNPFNPETKISFSIPRAGQVNFKVYNLLGENVYASSNFMNAGYNEILFQAGNLNLSSGLYFMNMEYDGISKTLKTYLLK